MTPDLDPSGEPVAAGRIRVRTPGFIGTVEESSSRGARTTIAGAGDVPEVAGTALGNVGIRNPTTVALSFTDRISTPGGVRRTGARAGGPEEGIEIEVPSPEAEHGQLIVATDGNGLVHWGFELPRERIGGGTRTTGRLYRIEAPVPQTDPRGTRLVGFLAKTVVKVLVFPLVEKGIGKVANHFAGKWEKEKRPYRLRTFLPPNYTEEAAEEVTADQILAMNGKRALLMVHGTFSRSHSGMGRLTPEMMKALAKTYEDRILAFDHYTISDTPSENVGEFIGRLPPDTDIEFDIICHSRGGLVSRVLAETQGALSLGSRRVGVRKIVFVATPNAGTVLADANHYGDLVDRYTNILTLFPAPGAVDIIETVLTVVKQLAVGAFKGLDGIRSMVPDGDFLRGLNAGPASPAQYYAFAANYEPKGENLTAQAKDFLIDKLFGKANDQIVPTDGVYEANGGGSFPIADPYVFGEDDGVQHSTYFATPEFEAHLRQWLGA